MKLTLYNGPNLEGASQTLNLIVETIQFLSSSVQNTRQWTKSRNPGTNNVNIPLIELFRTDVKIRNERSTIAPNILLYFQCRGDFYYKSVCISCCLPQTQYEASKILPNLDHTLANMQGSHSCCSSVQVQ